MLHDRDECWAGKGSMNEIFPHKYVWTCTDRRTGRQTKGVVSYRFIPIVAPLGWTTYPGQQCHDHLDGLLIEDSSTRWWEQDLWGAHHELYCLDIGCYGGVPEYICNAHAPDWHGEMLERVEFDAAEDAARWAIRWMTDPDAQRARALEGP